MIPKFKSLAAAVAVAVSAAVAACSNANGNSGTRDSSNLAVANAATAGGMLRPEGPVDSLASVADSSRIQGSPSAKVWLIEVSDFQCPYCKQWHDESYSTVLNDYVKTGKVRMAYVNFPLPMHQFAKPAAIAAMCAAAQGKFWQMHDALFTTQATWERMTDPHPMFDSLATAAGADRQKFASCSRAIGVEALVNGDIQRAKNGGVESTPSFWIGGKLYIGAIPLAETKAALDSALAKAK